MINKNHDFPKLLIHDFSKSSRNIFNIFYYKQYEYFGNREYDTNCINVIDLVKIPALKYSNNF